MKNSEIEAGDRLGKNSSNNIIEYSIYTLSLANFPSTLFLLRYVINITEG